MDIGYTSYLYNFIYIILLIYFKGILQRKSEDPLRVDFDLSMNSYKLCLFIYF